MICIRNERLRGRSFRLIIRGTMPPARPLLSRRLGRSTPRQSLFTSALAYNGRGPRRVTQTFEIRTLFTAKLFGSFAGRANNSPPTADKASPALTGRANYLPAPRRGRSLCALARCFHGDKTAGWLAGSRAFTAPRVFASIFTTDDLILGHLHFIYILRKPRREQRAPL